MLLWFWGSGRKRRFFDALTLPMDSFLRLGGAGDTQASMTVAQQRATVARTGASIKRARGALPPLAGTLVCGFRVCMDAAVHVSALILHGVSSGKERAWLAIAGVGIFYSTDIAGVPPVMLQMVRAARGHAAIASRRAWGSKLSPQCSSCSKWWVPAASRCPVLRKAAQVR